MFIGIDVAKDELVVAARSTQEGAAEASIERWTVPNDERSAVALAERLLAMAPSLIVLRGYGRL